MRKTLGGIKHHWRPVYDQTVVATTNSTNYVTILDLTTIKRGKVAIFTANYGWAAFDMYTEIYIDGVTTYAHLTKGQYGMFRADYHFNKSIRIRHKTSSQIVYTSVAYWVI